MICCGKMNLELLKLKYSMIKTRIALPLNALILSLFFTSCTLNEGDDFAPAITMQQDKITCQYCADFGMIIEVVDNEVYVVEYDDIYVFKESVSGFELMQHIIHENTSGIFSLKIHEGKLYCGLAEDHGTGKVEVYERRAGSWEVAQELRIGRQADNFGSAIDIYSDYMVIGASAIWDGWSQGSGLEQNTDEGRIYTYKNQNGRWQLEQEFKADDSRPDDHFGATVAIQGNYIFAGSVSSPLHVYERRQEWELIHVDSIMPLRIVHDEHQFIVRNSYGYYPDVFEFDLSENGAFAIKDAGFDYMPLYNISSFGEMFELKDGLLLTSLDGIDEAILFERAGEGWLEVQRFSPDDPDHFVYTGLEIYENKVYLAGRGDDTEYMSLYRFPI